jgi:type IV secretory pathway TrbL component
MYNLRGVYSGTPRWIFEDVLKTGIFSGVKCLLLSMGVQILAKIITLPQGPTLGLTNGDHIEVY